jgi:hypothetical protein
VVPLREVLCFGMTICDEMGWKVNLLKWTRQGGKEVTR